jgi:phosphatidylglycerol:prolipoprotein diacylglycerol transferase
MIDPIIFQFKLFNIPITLRWYGVLVMLGAVVGAWITEREIRRRGENGEAIWDALVWVLPLGIIGARLWYVVNSILGGSTYYTDNPAKIINIPEGGLHIFGGFLFGAIALYFFLKSNKLDFWLFLDSIAPAMLIGQALARPANFINQELYGPPTKLPWGIPIEATHRLAQYADLSNFPVDGTRFHPTFAYEMILNILLGLLLLWISRQYADKMKPGAIFAGWLISAGLARSFIEFFRPDQPHIGNSFVTTSMLVSLLMAIAGIVMLLVRYGKLQLAFAQGWEEEYQIKPVEVNPRDRRKSLAENVAEENMVEEKIVNDVEAVAKPARKKSVVKNTATLKSKTKTTVTAKPKAKPTAKAKPVTQKTAVKPKSPK